MKTKLLILALLCPLGTTFAQDMGVDSKNESVFTYNSGDIIRLGLSADEPVSVSYSLKRGEKAFLNSFLTKSPDSNVVKKTAFTMKGSLLNSGEFLILTKLHDLKPGVQFEVGYGNTITLLNRASKGTWCGHANLFASKDHFSLYNPADSSIHSNEWPFSWGINLNGMYFLPTNTDKKVLWSFASVVSGAFKTWNDDELISYQIRAKTNITDKVVGLEDFEGRYGELQKNVHKLRFALSAPIFFTDYTLLNHLNFIPYGVLVVRNNRFPQYSIGGMVNFLEKQLERSNFDMPSAIGIGLDWGYSKLDGWSTPNIFLKGTISFGKN